MIGEKWLLPDELADTFETVTPEKLAARGIRWIFSDIDNTLATYDDALPPESVRLWCKTMADAGIGVAFVSNNERERVETFGEPLGVPCYPKAKKPLVGTLSRAMKDCGAAPAESLLLGDQLLTDAAAGRRMGMYVIIVPPIKDKTTPFFRFKRWIERPYMRKMTHTNKKGV